MKVKQYYQSLRFKITLGLLLSLVVVLAAATTVEYLSLRRLLTESLERSATDADSAVDSKLGVYLRRRLVLSGSAILALVLIAELLLNRTVVGRLRQSLRVVKEAGLGNLGVRRTADF